MNPKTVIYDIEIKKAILGRGESRVDGIEYCDGFHDHANMGISCIGAYDYTEDRYRVFTDGNFEDFLALIAERDTLVSFNGIAFDNPVVAATLGTLPDPAKDYDILVEIWKALGMAPKFSYPSHTGYSMDAFCMVNGLTTKTENGALAPIYWQQGKFGKVIDYCLNDVKMTRQLLEMAASGNGLKNPKNPTGALITLKAP